MIDVIKEYLVSLGMSVDKHSFGEATRSIRTLETGVTNFAGTTVKSFALASTAIVSSLAAANAGIAIFLGNLAKADLETEKFARKMWLSKDTAESLKNSLSAMGATLEDLYLSPELLRNFNQLRATISGMKPPPEFQSQMKTIRSVQFEFQRMRLEATYALKWVGFYLFKYLEVPIQNSKRGLKGFNDAIIKSMPRWTKNVAQFFSWIARLGIAFVKGGRDVFRLFEKLGDYIPDRLKIIGAALVALGLLIKMGPFGLIFTLFTGLLLLLDDFYTYLEGGESALGPLWKKLQEFFKLLKDTGVIDRLGESFASNFRKIEGWIKTGREWIDQLFKKLEERGYLDSFVNAWWSTFDLLYKIIEGLWEWISEFFDDLNESGVLSGLIDSVIDLGKEVFTTIGWVADLVSTFLELESVQAVLEGIGSFISGTLQFGLEHVKQTIDSIVNGVKLARAWLSDDAVGLEEALVERKDLTEKAQNRASYYGGKIKEGISYLFADDKGSNPFVSNSIESAKQTDKLNNSVTNLPKGMEPSFKKALNESEMVKGFRTFNQDLNKGFNLMAMMINPDLFAQFHEMSTGLPNSYMYSSNSTSNQTYINNENKPVIYINSSEPKAVAREIEQQFTGWPAKNIRTIQPVTE
ncbi:hypothetical protein [Brevibacillus sp. MER 51]|uniref:hypothetical protein n=1 Tax=Brevibacillus sp. MER 51 TaxID=2939560 RepID=UPI00203B63C1|nr:hypothetical protein [Brevibacillus sp. MER 51]MCM3141657.1 hypothetical protein [Brevibacillus sp. MER 51]